MEKKGTNSRLLQTNLVKNLNNVDSLNINPKVFQITEQVRLHLIFIRIKIISARVMYHVERSHNVYISSATLTVCCHFTRIERFYGDLMLPWKNKTYSYLGLYVRCQILTQSGVSQQFSYTSPISNFRTIRPVAVTLINVDRRKDMTKQKDALRYYANGPLQVTKLYFINIS